MASQHGKSNYNTKTYHSVCLEYVGTGNAIDHSQLEKSTRLGTDRGLLQPQKSTRSPVRRKISSGTSWDLSTNLKTQNPQKFQNKITSSSLIQTSWIHKTSTLQFWRNPGCQKVDTNHVVLSGYQKLTWIPEKWIRILCNYLDLRKWTK